MSDEKFKFKKMVRRGKIMAVYIQRGEDENVSFVLTSNAQKEGLLAAFNKRCLEVIQFASDPLKKEAAQWLRPRIQTNEFKELCFTARKNYRLERKKALDDEVKASETE